MRIGEAARRAGMTSRTLRFYEQEGLIDASRNQAGHREYDEPDIDRLRLVGTLRAAGLTVGDVSALMGDLDRGAGIPGSDICLGGSESDCSLTRVTSHRIAVLERVIAELSAARERLLRVRADGL